jgi:hypothetical protein
MRQELLAFKTWDGDEAIEGVLICAGCSGRNAVVRGVPRMNAAMAGPSRVPFARAADPLSRHRPSSVRSLDPRLGWTSRRRTLDELRLAWFDKLSPQYDTTHSEPKVIGWFRAAGFEDIVAIEEPKVGVGGVLRASV